MRFGSYMRAPRSNLHIGLFRPSVQPVEAPDETLRSDCGRGITCVTAITVALLAPTVRHALDSAFEPGFQLINQVRTAWLCAGHVCPRSGDEGPGVDQRSADRLRHVHP